MIVEAKASADYWRAYASAGLREAKGGNLPRTWLRFANRQKGVGFLGSKHASHPVNAMLNYAYVVEAGRLAKALVARGLALQIGYLHSDKKGRNSLVWDAIEPLRVEINDRVFRYIESREFKRSDFVQTSASSYRLERDIIQQLLHETSLSQDRISEGADFMFQTIERHAGEGYRLFKQDMRRRKREAPITQNIITTHLLTTTYGCIHIDRVRLSRFEFQHVRNLRQWLANPFPVMILLPIAQKPKQTTSSLQRMSRLTCSQRLTRYDGRIVLKAALQQLGY